MVLTLGEKQKLLNKATDLYNEVKKIKIRKQIDISIQPKYYDSNSRYSNWGAKYYVNGGFFVFGEDINKALEDLKNYIAYKNGGEQYINGKSVSWISDYTINALLDFVYYGQRIIDAIKRTNENERKELSDLLG